MDAVDLPERDKWYCPSCTIRKVRCVTAIGLEDPLTKIYKNPPPKPTRSSFMSPLIHQLQLSIPKEFQLPDEIRNFFKDGLSFCSKIATYLKCFCSLHSY